MMENPTEIPIIYEGIQKWITGLTPKTTCDDVIHSVLINVGCPIPHEAVRNYALFENWRGVERVLKGRSRFMKLWRDWGEERSNVEVTMRQVDSSVKDDVMYGTMRRKNRIKDWFKTKDKKKTVSKSAHNIYQDVQGAHHPDDSSILAQNKDNMFCAFTCYKKKHRGLRERDMNVKTPFERPRSVAVVQPRSSLPAANSIYQDVYNCQDSIAPAKKHSSVSHIYGSKTSLKQTYVSKRRSCYVDKFTDGEPIYAIAKEAVCDAENDYERPKPRGHCRLPQNVHDWDYDYSGDSAESGSEGGARRGDYNDARFKSLLNLVLSQERTIQEQFSRIQQADRQIEQYELAMHRVRAAEQGSDYLQHTYLDAHNAQPESATRWHQRGGAADDAVKMRRMDELGDICDKVTLMDDQLREQYEKLHDLSLQLEAETKQLEESIHADNRDATANTTQAEGPFESTRLSPKSGAESELQLQISALREQLKKSISTTLAQQQDIKKIDLNLYQYQSDVQTKQDQLQKLLGELSLSSYEKSLLCNTDADSNQNNAVHSPPKQPSSLSQDVQLHAPRALTRQLRSLGDLHRPASHSLFQPGMRRSVSDVRDTPERGGGALLPMTSRDARKQFTEMGVDVGHLAKEKSSHCNNKTDDIKHKQQVDTNSEVQRIMSLRQPVLTPIKEQDFTHTIVEYHNETVDFDAFIKTGRFQNPTKMFSEKDTTNCANNQDTKAEPLVLELIYDSAVKQSRDASEPADVSTCTEASVSTLLPPLGLETMSTFKGKKLMPSLLNDTTTDSRLLDVTETAAAPLALSEETSVWGTPAGEDKPESVAVATLNATSNNTEQNNTSIWNTQDIASDSTFTVVTAASDVPSQTGELTPCDDSMANDHTLSSSSPRSRCPGTDVIIRQTIAKSILGDSPEPLCSVKKRLFTEELQPEDTTGTMETSSEESTLKNKTAQLSDVSIPEVTELHSPLSPFSVASESCESGVGSMPSEDLTDNSAMSWGSSFSETTV